MAREKGTAPGPPPDDHGQGTSSRRAFLLRIPPDLLAELRSWANQDLRSLNAHLEFLLREAVRRRKTSGEL